MLHQELSSLLLKGAMEEVPQLDLKLGFFSRYFLVPKKDGGLQPILDLRRLELPFVKGELKMLTLKTITSQVQVEDWFVTVDLEMPIFPFKSSSGTGNSFSLPLEESLTSTKFFPLAWPGLRPEEVHKVHGCCSAPFDAPGHLWQTLFLGVHLDSVQMQARLAPARISIFNACLARFKLGHNLSVSTCRRLLGLMAAASPMLPLGLLHMRPFLWWMSLLRIRSKGPATCLIRVSRSCFHTFLIWSSSPGT